MKLIRVIFLALPFFVNPINAASMVFNPIEEEAFYSLSTLDKDFINALNFNQVKGTKKNSATLHLANRGSSKQILLESLAIIEDKSKLFDWQAKLTNTFNKEQFLKLNSLSNPLLTQKNNIQFNKNSATRLSETVKWYITAGHFRTKANAIAFMSRLKRLGFKVLIRPLAKGASVFIGPYDFRLHAAISMEELKNMANVHGALIHFKSRHGYA